MSATRLTPPVHLTNPDEDGVPMTVEAWPLDQRIGENLSVVRLGDVVGMPVELHGLTFVIDRPPSRIEGIAGGSPRIAVYLDGAARRKLELVTEGSGFAFGVIAAADALRGLREDA